MKAGSPTLQVDGSGLRVAIVAASWHATVMDGLIDGARRGLADAGVASVELVRVPGADNAAYLRTKRDRMGHDLILSEHDKGASA